MGRSACSGRKGSEGHRTLVLTIDRTGTITRTDDATQRQKLQHTVIVHESWQAPSIQIIPN